MLETWHLNRKKKGGERATDPEVGLEMTVVHGVEAQERGEEPHISQGESVAGEVPALREDGLNLVEMSEEVVKGAFVSLLGGGKAALIHPVIDVVVNPRVDLLNLGPQILRVQVEL